MRIAIFSDIHGNRHALDAVLADLKAPAAGARLLPGRPRRLRAVSERGHRTIRSEGFPTIMGNYDDGVGFDRDECGCAYREVLDHELGQQSLEWTKAHTTAQNKAFLRSTRAARFASRPTASACSSSTAARGR